MTIQERETSSPAEKVKGDAKGAMAPSHSDPSNDGAHSANPPGDATQPPHDHSWPSTPETEQDDAGVK